MSTPSNNIEIIVRPQEGCTDTKKRSRSPSSSRNGAAAPGSGSDRRAGRSRLARSRDRPQDYGPDSDRRVHVSNIPYDYRWQDLKDLFRDNVGDVTRVELFSGDCGTSRGSGLVEFRSADVAQRAVRLMHRREVCGRKIVVKLEGGGRSSHENSSRDNGFDHAHMTSHHQQQQHNFPSPALLPLPYPHNINNNNGGVGGGGVNNMAAGAPPHSAGSAPLLSHMPPQVAPLSVMPHQQQQPGVQGQQPMALGGTAVESARIPNTFGLSMAFLESLGIDGPLVERVFVANLDYRVDRDKLRDVFALAGSVVHVQLNTDRDGRSKGHGTVLYAHPVEAVQAVSMLHNQIYMDRPLTVRMDRQSENELSNNLPTVLPPGLRAVGPGLGQDGAPLSRIVSRFSDPVASGPSTSTNHVTPTAPHAPQQMAPSQSAGRHGYHSGPMGALAMGLVPQQHTLPSGGASVAPSIPLNVPPSAAAAAVAAAVMNQLPPPTAAAAAVNHFPSAGLSSCQQLPPLAVGNQQLVGTAAPAPTAAVDMSAMMALHGGAGGVARAPAAAMMSSVRPPVNPSLTCAILVENLNPSCSAERLRDKYSGIGAVSHVQLRAPGVAVVHFERPEQAAQAVALTDRCRLDDCILRVTLY